MEFGMVINKDVVQQKERKLTKLQAKSNSAIQMVQSTIGYLEAVNSEIQSTQTEIDTYMSRLEETRSGLASTFDKNQKIMQNFKQLLCVD